MTEQITIDLAPPRKPIVVDVPDGMTMQTARDRLVRQGELTPEDIGQESPEPGRLPFNDPRGAGIIAAGEFISTLPERIGTLFGDPEAARQHQLSEDLIQPLRDEFPIATAVGRGSATAAIPGGIPVQAVAGGAFGALENPDDPLVGASLGVGLSLLGGFGANALARRLGTGRLARSGSAANRARAQARVFAQEAGIPLTVAETTGGRVAHFFDRAASTVLGRQVGGPSKQRALNKAFAKSIGSDADALTGDVLSEAATRFGKVFEDVANTVDEIPITPQLERSLAELTDQAAEIVPNARAQNALNTLEDMITSGKFTGKQYQRLRSQFGKFSRNEWSQGGDQVSGEFLDDIINAMDGALTAAAPDSAAALGPARAGWRQLLTIRRGASLDPSGNVNPVAMSRSMEKTYPGLDLNRFSPGEIGGAQRANLAATAFPAFRSSGTAERSVVGNLGASAVGIAELLAGGGAARQIGGAGGRTVSPAIADLINNTSDAMMQFIAEPEGEDDENESE